MKFDVELAFCAQINFENLEKVYPVIKNHPYYLIAKTQLDEALGGRSVDEILKSRATDSDDNQDRI